MAVISPGRPPIVVYSGFAFDAYSINANGPTPWYLQVGYLVTPPPTSVFNLIPYCPLAKLVHVDLQVATKTMAALGQVIVRLRDETGAANVATWAFTAASALRIQDSTTRALVVGRSYSLSAYGNGETDGAVSSLHWQLTLSG